MLKLFKENRKWSTAIAILAVLALVGVIFWVVKGGSGGSTVKLCEGEPIPEDVDANSVVFVDCAQSGGDVDWSEIGGLQSRKTGEEMSGSAGSVEGTLLLTDGQSLTGSDGTVTPVTNLVWEDEGWIDYRPYEKNAYQKEAQRLEVSGIDWPWQDVDESVSIKSNGYRILSVGDGKYVLAKYETELPIGIGSVDGIPGETLSQIASLGLPVIPQLINGITFVTFEQLQSWETEKEPNLPGEGKVWTDENGWVPSSEAEKLDRPTIMDDPNSVIKDLQ